MDQRSSKLLSLEARNSMPTTSGRGLGALDGAITLRSGYNMELDAEANDAETDVQEITLAAIPGAGLGVVPCDDTSIVFEDPAPPQQLHPDTDGNVRIVGDDCYDVLPDRTAGTIQLQGSCYACCDCDDFTAVGDDVSGLLDRTAALYTHLSKTHQGPTEVDVDPDDLDEAGYEQAVTYWNLNHSSASDVYPEYIHFQAHGARGARGAKDRASLTLSVKNALKGVDNIYVKFWIYSFAVPEHGTSGWLHSQDGAINTNTPLWVTRQWSISPIGSQYIPNNVTKRVTFELRGGQYNAIEDEDEAAFGTFPEEGMWIWMEYHTGDYNWVRGGEETVDIVYEGFPPAEVGPAVGDQSPWDNGRAKYQYPLEVIMM